MKSTFDLSVPLQTAWSGSDLVVSRNDVEIDRLHAPDIERIVFVQSGSSDNAGDMSFALVELKDEYIVFPVETGLAGRVHFERQSFWESKACIYWADAISARLPAQYLARRGFAWARREPQYGRIARAELAPVIEHWLLEGPQSWDERRWQRIERSQPFARIDTRVSPMVRHGGRTTP